MEERGGERERRREEGKRVGRVKNKEGERKKEEETGGTGRDADEGLFGESHA